MEIIFTYIEIRVRMVVGFWMWNNWLWMRGNRLWQENWFDGLWWCRQDGLLRLRVVIHWRGLRREVIHWRWLRRVVVQWSGRGLWMVLEGE